MEEVEHLKHLKRIIQRNGTIGKALDECAEYEKIGTVEECRQAREKQRQKKVVRQHEEPTDEEIKELIDLGFCNGNVIRCPNCNEYIVIDKLKYCMECGQRLDLGDTD